MLGKEEAIERKSDTLDRKEASLASRESNLNKQKAEVEKLQAKHLQELERISGLTSEQAKEYLLTMVEDDVKHETAVMIKEMTTKAKKKLRKRQKNMS